MEETFARIEELAGNIKEYVNSRIDSVKLSIAEKSSKVISIVLASMIAVMVFIMFFFFLNIAVAYLLGEWIGRVWAGFLIVAGFYLVIGIVVWIAKERIFQVPIMNALIRQLFKNDEHEEDQEH